MKLSTAILANSALALTYEVVLHSDIAQTCAISGKVVFSQVNEHDAVRIKGRVTGLAPLSCHGFHIHTAPVVGNNCSTASTHWNPLNESHGAPGSNSRHYGDLPMLEADENGVAVIDETNSLISLYGTGDFCIQERALVVHELSDDYGTKPYNSTSLSTGNAG